ncbi:T-cell immunomodulatory protein-like [Myotis lucifugus]|uniref:T-cell immunomodulatory protein-like n=1 Tax=Myotis lucifugus TaxID=59463 RepID=UPI0003C4D93C|nr:T-cell immunomodulatory protein-like [Myotis lucifugus]
MDHLLPGCEDRGCQRSAIYLARSGTEQWVPVLQDFSNKGTLWGFVPFVQEQHPMEIPIPITLRIGDYNMDGYPDALAILKNTSGRYGK